MTFRFNCIGCSGDFEDLVLMSDKLNLKVVEQLNESQDLIMLNMYAQKCNEMHLKKCVEERILEIDSWMWVFRDLLMRLEDAKEGLAHEHKAVRVVTDRIQNEIDEHSRMASKPGILGPLTDAVEQAILEEYKFLCNQKKKFYVMKIELEEHLAALQKIMKQIKEDILRKEEAVTFEAKCRSSDVNVFERGETKKKRNRKMPLLIWEKRCDSLKKIGLETLSNALFIKQQVHGSRLQLSTDAQAHSTRVDAVLRRRLHINEAKLEELKWQKTEALRDLQSLDEESLTADQSLFENLDQIRLKQMRLADRKLKPRKELTKDNIDMSLRGELARLKKFNKELRNNIERIDNLRNKLNNALINIDCAAEDIRQIINLDSERISSRRGESRKSDSKTTTAYIPRQPELIFISDKQELSKKGNVLSKKVLQPIIEENENYDVEIDDYPFDY